MADPTVIQCSQSCTVTVVHELSIPPFQLTADEAYQIGGAIVLVWAIGYGFRVVGRQISKPGPSSTESE